MGKQIWKVLIVFLIVLLVIGFIATFDKYNNVQASSPQTHGACLATISANPQKTPTHGKARSDNNDAGDWLMMKYQTPDGSSQDQNKFLDLN